MSEAFTTAYQDHLYNHYPEAIVDQIVDQENWGHAPVPGQPDETVPYVHVRPTEPREGARPMLYVPGFVEGIVNKASTAAALAERGYEVVLPGQNRAAIAKEALDGDRTMADFQADNYLSVHEHAGLRGKDATILARSYGGVIFNAMSRRARADGDNQFERSDVFMLASAGLVDDEKASNLLLRWGKMMKSEMDKSQQDFPDIDGSTGKASIGTMRSNVPRAFGEFRELVRARIDRDLPQHVGRLIVMRYAEDALFPQDRTETLAAELMDNGAVLTTPVSLQEYDDGKRYHGDAMAIRGGRGAVHDDEQLNPGRVAGAIDHVLRHSA